MVVLSLASEPRRVLACLGEPMKVLTDDIVSLPDEISHEHLDRSLWKNGRRESGTPRPGDIVLFHGLLNAADLNGQFATVLRWHETLGRWAVRLQNGASKFVKEDNVNVVQRLKPSRICSLVHDKVRVMGPPPGLSLEDASTDASSSSSRSSTPPPAVLRVIGLPPGLSFDDASTDASSPSHSMTPPRAVARVVGAPPGLSLDDASTDACPSPPSNTSPADVKAAAQGERPLRSSGADATTAVSETVLSRPGSPEWTTVMMRNIPTNVTRDMLLKLLDDHGFWGSYSFVYLPMDYQRKASFGYAFVDLVSPMEALRFHECFEGFSRWGVIDSEPCCVTWSNAVQGTEAHILRYRNSPVMHSSVDDSFKPLLFIGGRRVPFPSPTEAIRAPRLKMKSR